MEQVAATYLKYKVPLLTFQTKETHVSRLAFVKTRNYVTDRVKRLKELVKIKPTIRTKAILQDLEALLERCADEYFLWELSTGDIAQVLPSYKINRSHFKTVILDLRRKIVRSGEKYRKRDWQSIENLEDEFNLICINCQRYCGDILHFRCKQCYMESCDDCWPCCSNVNEGSLPRICNPKSLKELLKESKRSPYIEVFSNSDSICDSYTEPREKTLAPSLTNQQYKNTFSITKPHSLTKNEDIVNDTKPDLVPIQKLAATLMQSNLHTIEDSLRKNFSIRVQISFTEIEILKNKKLKLFHVINQHQKNISNIEKKLLSREFQTLTNKKHDTRQNLGKLKAQLKYWKDMTLEKNREIRILDTNIAETFSELEKQEIQLQSVISEFMKIEIKFRT